MKLTGGSSWFCASDADLYWLPVCKLEASLRDSSYRTTSWLYIGIGTESQNYRLATRMHWQNLSQTILLQFVKSAGARTQTRCLVPTLKNAQSLTCPLDHLYKRTQQTASAKNLDCPRPE